MKLFTSSITLTAFSLLSTVFLYTQEVKAQQPESTPETQPTTSQPRDTVYLRLSTKNVPPFDANNEILLMVEDKIIGTTNDKLLLIDGQPIYSLFEPSSDKIAQYICGDKLNGMAGVLFIQRQKFDDGHQAYLQIKLEKPDISSDMTLPQFKGGDIVNFRRWVSQHVTYPIKLAQEGVQGVVIAGFTIEPDGSLAHISIINSPSESLSREVIRTLKKSPLWTPGSENGEPTRYSFIIPIIFRAESDPVTSDPDEPIKESDLIVSFQGGDLNTFREWVSERLIYPEEYHGGTPSAYVKVRFVVKKNGKIANIKILESPHLAFSEEAIRVLNTAPRFDPILYRGKPIELEFSITLIFRQNVY